MASHWMWRLVLALLGLGLVGCPGDPFIGCSPPPAPAPAMGFAPGIIVTGKQVRMKINPTQNLPSCGAAQEERPYSGVAEVEGPSGEPLAAELTVGQAFSVPATLAFTPERPGPHHVTVTFSPTGGLHQFDLHAARDRSAESPREQLSMSCDSLQRTSKGAWVCGASVLRGDTVLQTFGSSWVAVAQDVIWVVDLANVYRYVDTGTDLVLSASLPHSRFSVEFLLASPDELLALHRFSVASYRFSAGVITSPAGQPWTQPSTRLHSQGPFGLLLREENLMGVAIKTQSEGGLFVQVCAHPLSAGGIQPPQQPCTQIPGELIGFEPGVLWTRDVPTSGPQREDPKLFRRWVWTAGQLVEQGSIWLGPNIAHVDRPLKDWEVVPLTRNLLGIADTPDARALLTWSPQRKVLLLEYFDSNPVGAFASPSLYWGSVQEGQVTRTHVRVRPPPL